MRSALSRPRVFGLFTRLLGGPAVIRWLVQEWVRPQPGERVLDLGCGLAPTLAHLPVDVSNVGIDLSAAYIAAVQRRYGRRGTFVRGNVTTIDLTSWGVFDHVLAVALFHHLPDAAVITLLQRVSRQMRRGGSIVTIDPSLENASRVARDNSLRSRRLCAITGCYRALLAPYGDVTIASRSGLLRIPYTHLVARVVVQAGAG
jgi:SAM-dependent methyltransferase